MEDILKILAILEDLVNCILTLMIFAFKITMYPSSKGKVRLMRFLSLLRLVKSTDNLVLMDDKVSFIYTKV